MGIFDFLKRSTGKQQTATAPESEELRQELFELILKNNLTEFESIAASNEATVIDSFSEWRRIPHEIQIDKEKLQRYSHCLMVIANYFQRERRRNEPMAMLTGSDGTETINDWKTDLGAAQKLMGEGNYDEALKLLEVCKDRCDNLTGPAAEMLKPLTLGHLGEAYFQTGQPEKAIGPFEQARKSAANVGDFEAQVAYIRNLYEVHRYCDRAAEAGKLAQEMSDLFYQRENLVLASNWKHQGRAVASGEPALRVVVKIGDEYFEVDEIPKVDSGKVEFIFMRNKIELRASMHRCDQGRELAEKGQLDEALPVFEQAMEMDPKNPVPHYFSAAIYMHKANYEKAVQCYERTEQLCPGWEGCRSELWLARKLASKEMEHDACVAAMQVINEAIPAETRLATCTEILNKYPNFAEMHFVMGKLLGESGKVDEAREIFRKGLEVAEDTDVKSRLLRDLALATEDNDEKLDLLEDGADLEGANLLAAAMCNYILSQELDADDA